MTRDEALAIVREYVKNENLIKHMYSRGSRHALIRREVRTRCRNLGPARPAA